MTRVTLVLSICPITLVLSLGTLNCSFGQTARASAEGTRNPVIVELFTSEGCSTCPPADALLARFAKEQPVAGAEIIAIEEHVDYWNRQGWMDPFSSSEWTSRQQGYVWKFNGKDVYTPQVVVDGHRDFVGNKEQEILAAIRDAGNQERAEITLRAGGHSPEVLRLEVRVGKLPGALAGRTSDIWLAVTERNLESTVKAGENAGKNLRHSDVLRSLRKIGMAKDAQPAFETNAEVRLKSTWRRENVRVVVFAQDRKSLQILGAASISVSE